MKLTGSRKEQEIREELLRSKRGLQAGSPLAKVLDAAGFNITGVYVLHWIPDQAEDIYTVLVSRDDMLIAEISRGTEQVHLEKKSL